MSSFLFCASSFPIFNRKSRQLTSFYTPCNVHVHNGEWTAQTWRSVPFSECQRYTRARNFPSTFLEPVVKPNIREPIKFLPKDPSVACVALNELRLYDNNTCDFQLGHLVISCNTISKINCETMFQQSQDERALVEGTLSCVFTSWVSWGTFISAACF